MLVLLKELQFVLTNMMNLKDSCLSLILTSLDCSQLFWLLLHSLSFICTVHGMLNKKKNDLSSQLFQLSFKSLLILILKIKDDIKSKSEGKFLLNSSISAFYFIDLCVKIFEFLFFLFFNIFYCSITLLISFLTLLILLDFEDFSHFHLFLIKLFEKILYFFYFREFWIECIKVVLELISFTHKTGDTCHGLRANNTLFMIGMSTLKMYGLFSVVNGISASFTIPISSVTIEFLIVIIFKLFS